MESVKEIIEKLTKLRKKRDELRETARRADTDIDDAEKDVAHRIIEHWLKNGGIEGRYFKAPYCCHRWEIGGVIDCSSGYDEYLYVKKLISAGESVVFYGQCFSLKDNGEHYKQSSIELDIQRCGANMLHPECEIRCDEFDVAIEEWKKRADKYAESLVGHPERDSYF